MDRVDLRSGPPGSRAEAESSDYSCPVVLIVDDHVDSRELLATVLQDVGVTVAEAGTRQRSARGTPNGAGRRRSCASGLHGTQVVGAIKRAPETRPSDSGHRVERVGPALGQRRRG